MNNYKDEKNDSPYRNDANAKQNYEHFQRNSGSLRHDINYKVHNSVNSYIRDRDGNMHCVSKILEPIYVMFSWSDRKSNRFSHSLSFHIDCLEFEEKLRKFQIKYLQSSFAKKYIS